MTFTASNNIKSKVKVIPNLDPYRLKMNKVYSTKINFKHKKINEGFVDIRNIGISGDNYYHKKLNPPYYEKIFGSIPELLLRESVANKLIGINKKVRQYGLELYVFDCYRPVAVQNFLYDTWYPEYLSKLHPDMAKTEALRIRDKYVAKSYNSIGDIEKNAPPPHSTGAAVDLTLRFIETKELLFMGSIFDDVGKIVYTDYYEKVQQHSILTLSEEEAQKNRRLLYWCMKNGDFENYPYEWWHFSYGDQTWAVLNEQSEAFYSCIDF